VQLLDVDEPSIIWISFPDTPEQALQGFEGPSWRWPTSLFHPGFCNEIWEVRQKGVFRLYDL
jgi:hypothetical protein